MRGRWIFDGRLSKSEKRAGVATRSPDSLYSIPHPDVSTRKRSKIDPIHDRRVADDRGHPTRSAARLPKGWGFTYHKVAKSGPSVSALMAIPPGVEQVKIRHRSAPADPQQEPGSNGGLPADGR